eukprot:3779208-Pleurochrysis_carterae.AAC.1
MGVATYLPARAKQIPNTNVHLQHESLGVALSHLEPRFLPSSFLSPRDSEVRRNLSEPSIGHID